MKLAILLIALAVTLVDTQSDFFWSTRRGDRDKSGGGGGFISSITSSIGGQINGFRDLGKWLTSSNNPNYQDYSDEADARVGGLGKIANTRDASLRTSGDSVTASIIREGRKFFSSSNLLRKAYEGFVGVSTCLMGQEYDDPSIGEVHLNATYYCSSMCGRMVPGLTCCTPQSPDLIDAKLILFKKNEKSRYLNWRSASEGDVFRKEKKVVFLVHGWLEKISFAQWITDIANGYTSLGYAVVVVDWRGGNSMQYWQAAANVRTVGAILGHAIGSWGIAAKTLFVGFSLGGQMIAEVSKYLKRTFNQQMDECHGLDPAGPFFDGCDDSLLLDRSDCRLVQVIHTSSGDAPVMQSAGMMQTAETRFGTYKKSGHCDYWVNCGHNQGPCVDMDFPNLTKSLVRLTMASDSELLDWMSKRLCSHFRATQIYTVALKRDRVCPAYTCPDCGRSKHLCTPLNGTQAAADDVLPPFSRCTPKDNISYYVESSAYYPFCQS